MKSPQFIFGNHSFSRYFKGKLEIFPPKQQYLLKSIRIVRWEEDINSMLVYAMELLNQHNQKMCIMVLCTQVEPHCPLCSFLKNKMGTMKMRGHENSQQMPLIWRPQMDFTQLIHQSSLCCIRLVCTCMWILLGVGSVIFITFSKGPETYKN